MTGSPHTPLPLLAAGHGLAARTVALDAEVDLLAFAGDDGVLLERDGSGVAGRGVAARIVLPDGLGAPDVAERVAQTLASITSDDEVGLPGCGPVALGALPFDRAAPGVLVVPETLLGRAPDGTCWLTTVGAGRPPRPSLSAIAHRPPGPLPDAFTLTTAVPHAEWCALVETAVGDIAAGRLAKVVLAREVRVEANRALAVATILARLRALYPSCTVFSVDGFVGASPELLVSRVGGRVASHPLAGTIPRSGEPEADDRLAARLLASAKDRAEHAMVVDAVAAALSPVCAELDVPGAPSIVALRNVSHLGTLVQGRLHAGPPHARPSALALAARLHPTPAVAGTPTARAVAYLRRTEGFDRGRYAGPVGWVDGRGDGTFVVGIRSAEIDGPHARLFAGVGIVEGSVADDELAETQLKLQALLAAVVRP